MVNINFFLTYGEVPSDYFANWLPDESPQKYSSGIGHNVLELAVRLKAKGHKVSIGVDVPSDSNVVIFFKKHFLLQRYLSLKILRIALDYPVILIRSDLTLEDKLIFSPDVEVMPNRSTIKENHQRFVPPLPQRGLIPRDYQRGNKVRSLGIKCNPENIPNYLGQIMEQVSQFDSMIELKIDSPKSADGSDNNWNDFSDVDLSLILRPRSQYPKSNARKPATRLINAWVAGTIPLVDPFPAYTELIQDKIDGFVINHPDEVAALIKTLVENPNYCAEIFANSRKRGEDYKVEAIVETWERTIHEICENTKIGLSRSTNIVIEFILTYLRK